MGRDRRYPQWYHPGLLLRWYPRRGAAGCTGQVGLATGRASVSPQESTLWHADVLEAYEAKRQSRGNGVSRLSCRKKSRDIMHRKTAIGMMALTVVAMPAALYAFATVAMWPNSTFEQLFETVDSPMITRKVVLQRLNAEGYGQHATSFVAVETEAQFVARLADIKRRVPSKRIGLEARGEGRTANNPVELDWRASGN
jgi:hypothetical protein